MTSPPEEVQDGGRIDDLKPIEVQEIAVSESMDVQGTLTVKLEELLIR